MQKNIYSSWTTKVLGTKYLWLQSSGKGFFSTPPGIIYCVGSSHERYSVKIDVLRNSAKFTRKHLCQSLLFNKVSVLRPATLFKKRLWHRCFPLNFVKFLRTPFYIEHLCWLLFPCLSLYLLLLPCRTTLETLVLSQKVVLHPLCCETLISLALLNYLEYKDFLGYFTSLSLSFYFQFFVCSFLKIIVCISFLLKLSNCVKHFSKLSHEITWPWNQKFLFQDHVISWVNFEIFLR